MGCRQTKVNQRPDENGHADDRENGNAPAPSDPRLPLTAREMFRLQQSWKGIRRNMDATGVEMFIRLFRESEELKVIFKDFKDLKSDDTLYENEALRHHGELVMTAIDQVITNLDDVDVVLAHLASVGGSHRRFPDFTSDLFYRIEAPFLDAVRTILEDRYTEQMAAIYKTTIKFIITKVSEGHKFNKGGKRLPSERDVEETDVTEFVDA